MAIIKVSSPNDQPGLLKDEPASHLIKCASDMNLRGTDLRQFVKRAGHHVADAMRGLEFAPGEVPVHLIALGAGEWFGMNRNGDRFQDSVCSKYHKTFEKHAFFFRDHANKDPRKSYGIVKLSIYNKPMRRIELIVALNGNRKAASRNKGLVADKELEKLARDESIGVSMACVVPWDVCSSCGNKARTRAEYCTGEDEGGHCKLGGLKNRITFVSKEGEQLCADNPDPKWFDISHVWRPADRIAYTNGILKAAASSSQELLPQPEVSMPWRIAHLDGGESVKLAADLAQLEEALTGADAYTLAACREGSRPTTWHDHGGTLTQALTALANEKIAMPLESFLSLVSGEPYDKPDIIQRIQAQLPGIYSRMLGDGSLEKLAEENPFVPSRDLPSRQVREWAQARAEDYSLSPQYLEKRARRASLYHTAIPCYRAQPLTKEAAPVEELARTYALYKLAFLQHVRNFDATFDTTCALALRENYL